MLVIVGYIVIIISVFGGFALAGGHLASSTVRRDLGRGEHAWSGRS